MLTATDKKRLLIVEEMILEIKEYAKKKGYDSGYFEYLDFDQFKELGKNDQGIQNIIDAMVKSFPERVDISHSYFRFNKEGWPKTFTLDSKFEELNEIEDQVYKDYNNLKSKNHNLVRRYVRYKSKH